MEATDDAPLITPLKSPWREALFTALGQVQSNLLVVSPFIKADIVADVERVLAARAHGDEVPLQIRVLTRVRLDDLMSRASDLEAFERLLRWPTDQPYWTVELRAIDNVHAKVWVLDRDLAIISSGNATTSGLDRNVEYGVALRERVVVERVLADWQLPWQSAEQVVTENLGTFRQYLESLDTDEQLRDMQREIVRRTSEIAQRVGVPARFGRTLVLSPSQWPAAQSTSSSSLSRAQPFTVPELASAAQETGSVEPEPPLVLRLDDLWEAIRWTVPGEDTQQGYVAELGPISALKLTREGKEVDIADYGGMFWFDVVRLIWADSTREVTATIPVYGTPAGEEPPRVNPWAFTLDSRAIQRLLTALNSYGPATPPSRESYNEVRIQSDRLGQGISSSGWRITHQGTGYKDEEPLGAPVSLDVVPATWETGLRPVSEPIAEAQVRDTDLRFAVGRFSGGIFEHLDASVKTPARVVEARLVRDPSPCLMLAASRGGQRVEAVVPFVYAQVRGPAIALRLDVSALTQMLRTERWDCRPSTWTVRIGQDANSIQFEPEPRGIPLMIAPFYSLLRWLYQVRSIE